MIKEGKYLYDILFYRDARGKEPVKDFIATLGTKRDKNSQVNYNKIVAYMRILQSKGITAGLPTMRRLEGDIWELRPMDNRILFVTWNGEAFVLLHHFLKKTQKTPQREIDTAKRRLKEIRDS
jgi:phage-related protein